MKPHRRKARINADRFENVRARERFLYEHRDEGHEDEYYRRPSPVRYVFAFPFFTLLITASVILGTHYFSEFPRLSLHSNGSSEPATGAALAHQTPANATLCDNQSLCPDDLARASIAWRYFQNNLQAGTGLVNAVDEVETTTMWDAGSSLAAFIAARDFKLISQHDFDHTIMALLQSLTKVELVDGVAPNILYNTRTAESVDYNNTPSDNGIGVSAIDLSRTAYWLNALQCMHPKYYNPVKRVLARWDYSSLIKDGKLYGLASDQRENSKQLSVQQGRFGFEQYAGRVFHTLGHQTTVAADYWNEYRASTRVLGVSIAHDSRDPRETGVNNFVVTDSYTLDAMELGLNADNTELLNNIYQVQKERWRRTGIATALTDGHINQPPYYLYNTIFDAGLSFTTTTDTGVRHHNLRTISTRAAFAMAVLFPDDLYSDVLMSSIESAYDPELGWFSGVYENGGFNDITTANTNGIILETILYKKYGELNSQCRSPWSPANVETPLPATVLSGN